MLVLLVLLSQVLRRGQVKRQLLLQVAVIALAGLLLLLLLHWLLSGWLLAQSIARLVLASLFWLLLGARLALVFLDLFIDLGNVATVS